MKNDVKYTTTRSTYKEVKRYDHTKFDEFCSKVYTNGWENGFRAGKQEMADASVSTCAEAYDKGFEAGKMAAEAERVDIEQVLGKIQVIKGIGTRRLEEIKESLSELFLVPDSCEEN